MPYVTERWPGGMLTNFPTIRKAVKKMISIDKMTKESAWDVLSKREKLQISRQRAKLEKMLGSIADLTRLPAALFIVDVLKEKIAVREAQRLGIPVFAMVDTNSQPEGIDFVIPANDDASQSISLIVKEMTDAIREGLSERKVEREKEGDEAEVKVKRRKAKVVADDEESPAIEVEDEEIDDLDDEEDDSDEEIDE
jgi:small subunit ribosomal protein S2